MSRSRDVSAVQNNLGVAIPPVAAGKNLLINGGFDIWQRGTSFASGGYMADRWTDSSTVSNMTASQQTSGAPNGSKYILRYTATAGSAYKDIKQYIETAQVQQAWGNTVTFSIKMRRNATTTGGFFSWTIEKSATVDAGSGATWTSLGSSNTTIASLTTGTTSADWTTVTVSASVPNDGTANSLRVTAGFSAAQASGSIIEFAQAQLELGSSATPFSRAGGTIQGELAACQRYYWRNTGTSGGSAYSPMNTAGFVNSATNYGGYFQFPIPMRTAPTSVDYSTLQVLDSSVGTYTVTAVGISQANPLFANCDVTISGATAGRFAVIRTNNSTSGYIGFSAEL